MNYNDFPVLNDEQYRQLQDKYNEQTDFDRNECCYSIYSELTACANSITLLFPQLNPQLIATLQEAKIKIEKSISNFEAVFNLSPKQIEIKEINLFNFLKNLTKIQKKLIKWLKNEQKEYFKQFILNLLENISSMLFDLLSAVESANLRIFKHI